MSYAVYVQCQVWNPTKSSGRYRACDQVQICIISSAKYQNKCKLNYLMLIFDTKAFGFNSYMILNDRLLFKVVLSKNT